MILPLLLAVLAFVVLLPIVLPLLRGTQAGHARGVFDQAVYRDQLRELDRDIARGLLTETEAYAARLEIQRRLLAAEPPATVGNDRPRQAPVLALSIMALVSIGSVALYGVLSEPVRLVDPGAAAAREQQAEIERLVARLKERLAADPNSQEGWRLYARTSAALADWDTAISAYQRAMALGDGTVDTLAAYGEVLVARARGTVIPLARETFQTVLAREPDNGMARFYLAIAAGQDGQPAEAIRRLQALAAEMPADAAVRGEIGRRVADFAHEAGMAPPALAPGRPASPPAAAVSPGAFGGAPSGAPSGVPSGIPSGAGPRAGLPAAPPTSTPRGPDQATIDAAASMPAADRTQMIRGMVARLAERLEQEPNDLDGWLRLGQSWMVLNEPEKAADAYERAAPLRPEDVTIPLRAVEALLKGRAVSDPLPPRAIAILRRIETTRPDEPAVLWYLGLVAAREGRKDAALTYWRRLSGGLPPGAPDAAMVRQAIEALSGAAGTGTQGNAPPEGGNPGAR